MPEGGFADPDRDDSFTLDGTSLSWALDWGPRRRSGPSAHGGSCASSSTLSRAAALGTGTSTAGTLSCAGQLVDVYELVLTAGVTVSITVDIEAAETAFQPTVEAFDESGCRVGPLEAAVDCTAGGGRCVAGTLTAAEAGTYRILVGVADDDFQPTTICNDAGSGAYSLVVDGATPTLMEDDAHRFDSYSLRYARITVTGTTDRPLE